MKRDKDFLRLVITSVVCSVVFLFCTSIQGVEKTYEVRPEITLPQYKTDTARAIDAQQQVTNRLLDQNERKANEIQLQLQIIIGKLNSIESKLDNLSDRVEKIEKAVLPKEPEEKPKPREPEPLTNK